MNTENEFLEELEEEVKQAFYNVKMDDLPLSEEFVLKYIKSELEKHKDKVLVRRKEDD